MNEPERTKMKPFSLKGKICSPLIVAFTVVLELAKVLYLLEESIQESYNWKSSISNYSKNCFQR